MIRSLQRSISSPKAEQDEEDGLEEDEKDCMMCRSQRRIQTDGKWETSVMDMENPTTKAQMES